MLRTAKTVLLIIAACWSAEALAAPPDHAPAHGWRKKNDPYYIGYTGHRWDRDFGIRSGRCNREEIGTVIGGVIGGVVGSEIADRDDRAVATIIGAAVGALIGNRVGRQLDEGDKRCFGHALEVGEAGQAVSWTNDSTKVRYEMTPGQAMDQIGDGCRGFGLRATSGERFSFRNGVACPTDDGVWRIASDEQIANRL